MPDYIVDKNILDSLLGAKVQTELFDTLPSTNTYALQTVSESGATARLIIAAAQSSGRGRMGRSFYSPGGTGLYMSVVLFPDCEPELFQRITPAAAVSVCKAVESEAGLLPRIKWVNDILLGGKKFCGILSESVRRGEKYAVIVGVGINISTEVFPADVGESACSLSCTQLDVNALAAKICLNLIEECDNIRSGGVIDEYRARLDTLGKVITYSQGGDSFTGKALDVNSMGNLIVRQGDEIITLTSGEVTMHK